MFLVHPEYIPSIFIHIYIYIYLYIYKYILFIHPIIVPNHIPIISHYTATTLAIKAKIIRYYTLARQSLARQSTVIPIAQVLPAHIPTIIYHIVYP